MKRLIQCVTTSQAGTVETTGHQSRDPNSMPVQALTQQPPGTCSSVRRSAAWPITPPKATASSPRPKLHQCSSPIKASIVNFMNRLIGSSYSHAESVETSGEPPFAGDDTGNCESSPGRAVYRSSRCGGGGSDDREECEELSREIFSVSFQEAPYPRGTGFESPRGASAESRRKVFARSSRSCTIQGVENEFHMYRNLDSVYSEENPLVIPMFFDAWRCNHVMPLSGKVVILEVNLKVEKAFYSLVENAMRAAPVWSSAKMEFIGMLTITDFIDVLLYYSSKEEMGDFENQKICNWRSITNKDDKFVHISPDASLTEAVKLLVKEKVHRLPIFDSKTQSVLYILTHKRILKYFYHVGLCNNRIGSIFPKPSFFLKSIGELKLGTYENVALADYSMTVIEALKIFHERRVSALPVVENGVLVDVYAKFDAFALATEKAYCNLSMTLKQALQERGEYHEPVLTCTLDDVLHSVLERIIESEVHRVVVVSPKNAVVGIISLSDILKFLVLKPLGISSCESAGVVEQKASPLHSEQEGLESSANNELVFPQTVHTDDDRIPFAEASDDDDVFSENHHGKDTVLNMNCSASSHAIVKEETLEEALDSLVIPEIS